MPIHSSLAHGARRSGGRVVLALLPLLLCACAPLHERGPVPTPAPEPSSAPPVERFEAEAHLDAAAIARLRAAPAPAATSFQAGTSWSGDEDRLGMQGLVRVGVGQYTSAFTAAAAPAPAQERARSLGADLALVYPPAAESAATRVAYYVRMALPFGATFRDLDAAERQRVGSGGVQLGSIVGGSPASRANLLPGDLVVAVDGAAVQGRADFQRLLQWRSGCRVRLDLWRGATRLQREVRLGVAPPR